jgi:hypothetical protein
MSCRVRPRGGEDRARDGISVGVAAIQVQVRGSSPSLSDLGTDSRPWLRFFRSASLRVEIARCQQWDSGFGHEPENGVVEARGSGVWSGVIYPASARADIGVLACTQARCYKAEWLQSVT